MTSEASSVTLKHLGEKSFCVSFLLTELSGNLWKAQNFGLQAWHTQLPLVSELGHPFPPTFPEFDSGTFTWKYYLQIGLYFSQNNIWKWEIVLRIQNWTQKTFAEFLPLWETAKSRPKRSSEKRNGEIHSLFANSGRENSQQSVSAWTLMSSSAWLRGLFGENFCFLT